MEKWSFYISNIGNNDKHRYYMKYYEIYIFTNMFRERMMIIKKYILRMDYIATKDVK